MWDNLPNSLTHSEVTSSDKIKNDISVSYLYGIELTVYVVLAPPQPSEGLLSLLLLAHGEKPPGG